MKCSICKYAIKPDSNGWDKGHNAFPINSGKCCGSCNDCVVLPRRLKDFMDSKEVL